MTVENQGWSWLNKGLQSIPEVCPLERTVVVVVVVVAAAAAASSYGSPICTATPAEALLAQAPKSVPPLHCVRRGLDKIMSQPLRQNVLVLSVLSLGVALRTGQSGASEPAETCIFLASIDLAFAGHVVYCFGYNFPGPGDGQRR